MYCGQCGEKLEGRHVLICPKCSGRSKNDANYCTYCGAERIGDKCLICTNEFDNISSKNRYNIYRKENIKGSIRNADFNTKYRIGFFILWTGMALLSLYNNATATVGHISSETGMYVSLSEIRGQIPYNIVFVLIGVGSLKQIYNEWKR